MEDIIYKPGDRVMVTASCLGYGQDEPATVSEVEFFMRHQLITVLLDHSLPDGSVCRVVYENHVYPIK